MSQETDRAPQIEKNSTADSASANSKTGFIDAVLACFSSRNQTEQLTNPLCIQNKISVDSGFGSEITTQPGDPNLPEAEESPPVAAPISDVTSSPPTNVNVPVQISSSPSTFTVSSTSADRPTRVPSPIPHRVKNARVLETVTHPRPYPPSGTKSVIIEEGAPPLNHLVSELKTPSPPGTSDGHNK